MRSVCLIGRSLELNHGVGKEDFKNPEMVRIEGGPFCMGSDPSAESTTDRVDLPGRELEIGLFGIGKSAGAYAAEQDSQAKRLGAP
jgi:hypothetical protein